MRRIFLIILLAVSLGGCEFMKTSKDCLTDSTCRKPLFDDVVSSFRAVSMATPPVYPWAPIATGSGAAILTLIAGLWKHYKDLQKDNDNTRNEIIEALKKSG